MLSKNKIFLTFDIDWASDDIVNQLIDLCLAKNIKATFFATHVSDTLKRLQKHSGVFEIGLHPNFMPGSTQGNSEEEIFAYCKRLVPNAVSIRTHCVYQHGRLYDNFNKHFGKRLVESSICMPGIKNIQPFELYTTNGCLLRVPFFWADDYYLLGKQVIDPIQLLACQGCQVYMFHPVHIYHNTTSMEHYAAIKKHNPLTGGFKGKGIADIFDDLMQQIINRNIDTGLMQEFLEFNKEKDK